ncbi:MAG: hypothetical protein IPJ79_02925 [Bacteroidetes bacterium]|nr:hypothetical protein [Bacteroidota bacterium]
METTIDTTFTNAALKIVQDNLIPNASYAAVMRNFDAINQGTTKASTAQADLAHNFGMYKGSPYYYSDSRKLIHFTSNQKLISILRDKKIRLYSLAGMDDNDEFLCSYKNILGKPVDDYFSNEIKKMIYCLSLCDYNHEGTEKSLNT